MDMRHAATAAILALACAATACREAPEQAAPPTVQEDPRCIVGLLAIEATQMRPGVPAIVHDIRSGARRELGNAPYNPAIPPIGDAWEGEAPGEDVWRTYFQTRGLSLVGLCRNVRDLMDRTGSTFAANLADAERSGPRLEIGAPVVLGDEALVDVGDFLGDGAGSRRLEYYRRADDRWSRVGVLALSGAG